VLIGGGRGLDLPSKASASTRLTQIEAFLGDKEFPYNNTEQVTIAAKN